MAFKIEMTKGESWIIENKSIFKGKFELPLYKNLLKKQKERINLLSMKGCLGDITKAEYEEMADALFFKFWEKEDFINFNKAMNEIGVLVFSTTVV